MKRLAHAKKRDLNEPGIVKALERAGATVWRLDDPVDLLVGFRGKNFTLEVKNPTGRNRDTPAQVRFREQWRGTLHTVRSQREALRAIGAPETLAQEDS